MSQSASPVKVFFSYAYEDEAYRDDLELHLSLLKRQGLVSTWHARKIMAGEEWADKSDDNLKSADIILLLISPNFIASDYCWEKEMMHALERHQAGTARVIPIFVRPSDWQSAPFAKLQGLPRNALPVSKWSDADEAWLNVAQGLRLVIEAAG